MQETISLFSVIATPPSIAQDPDQHRRRGFLLGISPVHYPMSYVVSDDLESDGRPVEGFSISTSYVYGNYPVDGVSSVPSVPSILLASWRLGLHSQSPNYMLVLPPEGDMDLDAARRSGGFIAAVGNLTPKGADWTYVLALGARLAAPVHFPEHLRDDLLFIAYAIAPLVVGPRWAERAGWPGWLNRFGQGGRFSYTDLYGPAAMFLPEEMVRGEVTVMTSMAGESHIVLRTRHRMFFSTRPVSIPGQAPGVVRTLWDGTWSGPLGMACGHPFLMAAATLPAQIMAVTLGPEVTVTNRDEMGYLTALFDPIRQSLPRVSAFVERGLQIEEIADRLRGDHPMLQAAESETIRWLLVAVVNLCQDSARLWPAWTAEIGSPTSPLVNQAQIPEA